MTKLQQLANTIAEAGREAGKLQWTTEAPTVPGWYWASYQGKYQTIILVDKIVSDSEGGKAGNLFAYSAYEEEEVSFLEYTHWLGPLPEPEPPPK